MPKATQQTFFEIKSKKILDAMNEETKEFVKHKSIKDATKRLIGL